MTLTFTNGTEPHLSAESTADIIDVSADFSNKRMRSITVLAKSMAEYLEYILSFDSSKP